MKMYYGGMETISLTDWPGEVATVIFFQGCPMKCPHCFNEAMLQPLGANLMDLQVIKDDLVSNPLITAVVLSGGETLMQPDAAIELLVYAKSIGLKTAIETCGYYPYELARLIVNDLLDMVFIDVKSELTDGSQSIATGIGDATTKVIDSLNICFATTIPFEIRTTVFPNFPNTIELANLAMDIKKLKKEYPNNELQGHVLQQGIAKESETYFEPVLKATLANMQKVLDDHFLWVIKMLTVEMLKAMPRETVFASGESVDGPMGINFMNSGAMLRWVAVRGGYHDWAVYAGPVDCSIDEVKNNGDKVYDARTIRNLVPCNQEAFKLYRQ